MICRTKQLVGFLLVIVACSSALSQQTETKRPKRIRISQGVAHRNVAESPAPKYPKEAVKQLIEGPVVMRVVISKDGKVIEVEVKSGHPILAEAAEKAVRKWRYSPYLLNDEPVEVETQVICNFNLKKRESEP